MARIISWHADFTKGNLELMKCLGLGEKHFFRFNFPKGKRGKRWSLRTPANRYAIGIIQKLFAWQCSCRAIERESRDKELMEIYKRHSCEVPRSLSRARSSRNRFSRSRHRLLTPPMSGLMRVGICCLRRRQFCLRCLGPSIQI